MGRPYNTYCVRIVGGVRCALRHFSVLCILCACLAMIFAFECVPRAYAEIKEDQNLVDPTQRADNSFIYDTTIETLFDQLALYDQRTVQVVGEVIGDCIKADDADNYWITLTVTDSEDKTSISILMSGDQVSQIDRFGKYGVTGTILQVRGIFHQACSEHDGLPDIHATHSAVMSKGITKPDTFEITDFLPGFIAILIGFALMGVFYFARERMR